jgi:hypothetical protein
MLKTHSTHSKFAHLPLALFLMLSLAAAPADARPTSSSSSFKSGFSSQRSSSSSSSSSSKSSTGSFGSFSRRSDTKAPASDARKSDSALSRKLDKESSEANALRTLDARRAAQAARENPPAPGVGQPAGSYQDNARMPPPRGYGPAPAQPPTNAPMIVRQDSGLGNVVAGAILARSAANAHANNNNGYYPAPDGSAGELANKAGAGSVGGNAGATAEKESGSVLGAIARTFLWLCVLSLIGWCVYFAWKRMRARREANKPNYSFERN